MRSRQNITDIFSTYIRFERDRFAGWLSVPRLRRNMNSCLTQVSETQASKDFFALYWHQHWCEDNHRLALMHLGAYLQEAGYWAADKFTSRFAMRQFSLADCFQIAFTKLEKGLSSYQADRGTSLESFAKLFFRSTIANELRRTKEIDVVSDWLLLRKLTRKQLVESLTETGGLGDEAVEEYRLAWMCFRQKYAEYREAGTHQLSKPTPQTWASVAQLYNQERLRHVAASGQAIDAVTVEQRLLNCAKWARSHLYPSMASLNMPSPGYDSGEAQDNLPANIDQSPIDKALSKEAASDRQLQTKALVTVLSEAIAQLKAPGETLLRQYYCEGLKQQDIAKQLEMKQYTVSRRLTSARSSLLTDLVKWRQDRLQTEITPDEIADISSALELWLQSSFCDT